MIKATIKKAIILILVVLALLAAACYFFGFSCCKPGTGLNCRYCPGISDNFCESWMTENSGICVKSNYGCPEGYVHDFEIIAEGLAREKYPCNKEGVLNSEVICCIPKEFFLNK